MYKTTLKSGSGNAKILVKAKGTNISMPALPLNPTPSLLVQLVKDTASGNECWQSTFTLNGATDNGTVFMDIEP